MKNQRCQPHPHRKDTFKEHEAVVTRLIYALGRAALSEVGLPISTDQLESLYGTAKHHGTGEIKDANRIATRLPALCGAFTMNEAEKILDITNNSKNL